MDTSPQAFRAYKLSLLEANLAAFRKTLPATPYTEDDVERLVHEVRAGRQPGLKV